MVIGIARHRTILVIPLLWYACVFVFGQAVWSFASAPGYLARALLVGTAILAVSQTRIVRRAGDRLDVLTVRGRASLVADAYLLHVETEHAGRFSTIRWQLACDRYPERSFAMGNLGIGARRDVQIAKTVLGLRPSFPTETWLHCARGTAATPRRQIVTLGVLLAIAIVLVIASLSGQKAGLDLKCNADQILRVSGGYGEVHGGRTIHVQPGSYSVELWLPVRSCWVRRNLSIAAGATTVVHCDDLATAAECSPAPPPTASSASATRPSATSPPRRMP